MMKVRRSWTFFGWLTILSMVLAFAAPFQVAHAETPQPPQPVTLPGLRVIHPARAGQTVAPLRVLAAQHAGTPSTGGIAALREKVNLPLPKAFQAKGQGHGSDPGIVQSKAPVVNKMPAPIVSFDGNGNTEGVLPPDTNGDIGYDPDTGTKYYFQVVNSHYAIWDVTDPTNITQVVAPTANNAMWSGFGGICESNNDGDPIVLFDAIDNRWLFSQFALDFNTPDFHQCIAVSQTADPTGSWYLYDYDIGSIMNDYPKFGVMPSAFYMTVNEFDANNNFAWKGAGVAAFDRQAMVNGDANATMLYIDVGAVNANYGGMLPADLDGTAPASDTPGYFIEWDDSTWLGDPADTLRIWEFHPDFTTPDNTTFGADANYTPNAMVQTADVDPDMCGFSRNCIPQPGGTAVDAISDRLMYRAAFRVLSDGSFVLLSNHTVDVDGTDHAGIHWFELKYDGTNWSMAQEGVYAPDSANRWMGSIAMDKHGDIALGYSVSSKTVYPSVRYTGRLSQDPLGEMTQGEAEMVAGGGSQGHSSGRWGDYSMMSVDPQDGCTFWYTQEYYAADSTANWQTRIGAFKFDVCGATSIGTISGTVTDQNTGDPLAGVKVLLDGGDYQAITDSNGNYAFSEVVAGDHTLTVSKWAYQEATATVTVQDGQNTTQDFALTPLPMRTIVLQVKDGDANAGWPLYASVDILDSPYNTFFTDPATGEVSVQLPDGDHQIKVHVLWPGYVDNTFTVTVSQDDTIALPMQADLTSCTAPGYGFVPSFAEDFNGSTFPPANWTVVDNVGQGVVWKLNTDYQDGNYTGGSGTAAEVSSDANSNKPYDTELRTPAINTADLTTGLTLHYKANYQEYSGDEALDLDISTDGGSTWTNILHWAEDHGSLYGTGESVGVDLASYVGSATSFMLRWRYYTPDAQPWDWYAQIDDVGIGGCGPHADGLIVGGVSDANTGTSLGKRVTVQDDNGATAMWVDTSADSATPAVMYVLPDAQGTVNVTARGYGYQPETTTVNLTTASVVRQDFVLKAPKLSLSPHQLDFGALQMTSPTASGTVTLSNNGTADPGTYQILAVKGAAVTFANRPEADRFAADRLSKEARKHLFDRDARYASVVVPSFEPDRPLSAKMGEVVASWPTGLASPWGIGVNSDNANAPIWVGDIALGGGQNVDHEYQTDGTATGNQIDVSSWVGAFAADMAYNPFTKTLWQVNVGGDYCLHELNPLTYEATGRTICGALQQYGISLRGLAYDPTTDTFFGGTWNYGGEIFRIAENGALLEAKQVNLPISGLAYNPSTGHLFAMINSNTAGTGAFDVYILDPAQGYKIIGAFNVNTSSGAAFGAYGQAGLSAACDGTLWAVNQGDQKVYAFQSGETGWCDWQADWVSVSPSQSDALPAANSQDVAVNVDLTGKPAGSYNAHLMVVAETPYLISSSNIHATLLPKNDESDNAIGLGVPSGLQVDTSTYTFKSDDPVPSCAGGRVGATAWYTVTTTADQYVSLDTFLSDYDTVLGVFSGSPGAFTEVACNDNAGGAQSHLSFQATAGTTYYIMVGAKSEGTGGNLHLHVTSFKDVPGSSWAWPYIEALYDAGITQGDGAGNYQPHGNVTRAQMAKFMLIAVHGAGYTPPSFSSYSFSDIDGSWAADWIEEAYQEGIVGGYADGTYRPGNIVTRAQMAKFMLVAVHGAGYTPPSFSSYSFPDIAGSWAADWIEELYQEGIVGGYSDGTYRPNNNVTRDQMAKFISNAFGLSVPSLTK